MFLSPDEAERIIVEGEAAEKLLGDASFLAIVDSLSDYHLAAVVACSPRKADQDALSFHHTMHHAIRELAAEVRRRIDAGREMASLLNMEPDDE